MDRFSILVVFLAIVFGAAVGFWIEPGSTLYLFCDLMGQLFMNALKLVIVPLVVSSIITGLAKMGDEEGVASLSLKMFGFYLLATTCAALVGLGIVCLMEPGAGSTPLVTTSLEAEAPASLGTRLGEILLKLFPPNIFQAAAEGQMLGLIVFSLLFGFFTSKIEPQLSGTLQSFWRGVFQVMMKITQLVMKFLPFGVFALMAKVIASTGLDAIKSSGWFFVTMLVGLALYSFAVLPLFLWYIGRVSPFQHFRAVGPALLTAFTTSSSAAAFPVTLECLEKEAGISNRIAGFTLPIGTSFHLAGTSLFICVAVIFIAQAFGAPLAFPEYFLILLLSIILSIGIAGVPSGCLVAVIALLTMLHLPLEGIALLFVVERILDMFRSAVNVLSNTVCTLLVARSEGERTSLHPS